VVGVSFVYDEALIQLVRQRFMQDTRTQGAMVDICCSEGCICLIGRVDTSEQKLTAGMLVEGMHGVKSVLNNITVRGE
jgi:osmotically-inducible protein OsmY